MKKYTKFLIIYLLGISAFMDLSGDKWLALIAGVFMGGMVYLTEDDS